MINRSLAVIACLLLSCALFHTPNYCPLEQGDTWQYAGKDAAGDFTQTHAIIGTTELADGNDGLLVETVKIQGNITTKDTLYLFRTDSVLRYYESDQTTAFWTMLKFPITPGDNWTVVAQSQYGRIDAVVLNPEGLTLPYGKVADCYKVEYKYTVLGITTIWYVWYGPDLGMVRWEQASNYADLTAFTRK